MFLSFLFYFILFFYLLFTHFHLDKACLELLSLRDGWLLRVGGGQRDQEDQRRDRGTAAERQEGLPQRAEAAAVR